MDAKRQAGKQISNHSSGYRVEIAKCNGTSGKFQRILEVCIRIRSPNERHVGLWPGEPQKAPREP